MTDKEPIIIDGIDVSVCKYLPYCNDKQGNCAYEPNCYFKKLAHKTQECEKYKARSESLQDIADGLQKRNHFLTLNNERLTQECEQKEKELLSNEKIINKLMKEVDELKQECEELKELLKLRTNDRINKLERAISRRNIKIDRYRKELEEIQILAGKIISNDDQPACVYDVECPLNGGVGFDNHCDENCPFISAKQILDIINKAKEEV